MREHCKHCRHSWAVSTLVLPGGVARVHRLAIVLDVNIKESDLAVRRVLVAVSGFFLKNECNRLTKTK